MGKNGKGAVVAVVAEHDATPKDAKTAVTDIMASERALLEKLKKVGDIRYDRSNTDKESSRWKYDKFTLDSIIWSGIYDTKLGQLSYDDRTVVPMLKIQEFQPRRGFIWDLKIKVGSDYLAKALSPKSEVDLVKKGIADAVIPGMSRVTQETNVLASWFNDAGGSHKGMKDRSMDYVKNLLTGEYLGSFEIPFLCNDYIKADFVDSWTGGGSEKTYGSDLSKVLQEHYGVNFPLSPTWSAPMDGSNSKTHEYDFYLINDTENHFIMNFKFLRSFISGNFWIQMGSVQQSPNVYHVECPGRFKYYFAAIGTTVEYMGKTRNITTNAKNAFSGSGHVGLGDMLIPEAFKITVKIKDLTPNNFNAYMDVLTNNEALKIEEKPGLTSALDITQTLKVTDGVAIEKVVSQVDEIVNSSVEKLSQLINKAKKYVQGK